MTRPAAATRLGFSGRRRRAVRSGEAASDTAAFEAVYRACHQELYRYARSIVRDDHAAEDVLQSTMERALVALQDESRDFELRPWLFRIAHNEAISRLRRDKPTDELQDALAATDAPVSEQLDRKQTLEDLWVDLATLPERQRQALVLRELSGMGHDEIGEVLGTSGRAVKQTIFEARRALLDCTEGRAMQCDDVQQVLSDGDGRVRRSRRMQSHLRTCRDCRAFDSALHERPEQLRALVPVLPVAAAASLLAQLAPGAPAAALGHAGGASAGFTLSSIGGAVATKAVVVAVASVTLVGGAGVTAVALRDAPPSRPAPSTNSSPPGAGAAAGAAGAAATAAPGAASAAAAAAAAQKRTGSTAAADGSNQTTPGAGAGDDHDAPQGAAGKARAAENRKAAALRRAAAAEKRANAAKGKSGSAKSAGANGKSKSSGATSKTPSKSPTTSGRSDAPAKAPAQKAPTTKAPAKAQPQPAPAAPAPTPSADAGAQAPSGGAPEASKKPETTGKPG